MDPLSDIDLITAHLRSEREQLRRRTLLLTMVPIVVAAVLIAVTFLTVSSKQQELAVAHNNLNTVQQHLDSARTDLKLIGTQKITLQQEVDSLSRLKEGLARLVPAAQEQQVQEDVSKALQAARLQPRVYLHIVSEEQRPAARQLTTGLEKAGLVVPGIEYVRRGPSSNELRFFRDEDSREAAQIQQLAADAGLKLKVRNLSATYGDSKSIRPGHFEIWLGETGVLRN